MAERTKREKTERFDSAIVMVGSTRNCRLRYHGWPGLPTPDGGNHWSATANSRISIKPSQNDGIASPSELKPVISASTRLLWRTAAQQPSGRPINNEIAKAVTARRSVLGKASVISPVTGRPLTSERPRFRLATSDSQTA